jgi:hypothetical protein
VTDPSGPEYERLPLSRHIAAALVGMAVVLFFGTAFSWLNVSNCHAQGGCPVPPAVEMLTGMGLTGTIGLLVGALLMWLPLHQPSH